MYVLTRSRDPALFHVCLVTILKVCFLLAQKVFISFLWEHLSRPALGRPGRRRPGQPLGPFLAAQEAAQRPRRHHEARPHHHRLSAWRVAVPAAFLLFSLVFSNLIIKFLGGLWGFSCVYPLWGPLSPLNCLNACFFQIWDVSAIIP